MRSNFEIETMAICELPRFVADFRLANLMSVNRTERGYGRFKNDARSSRPVSFSCHKL